MGDYVEDLTGLEPPTSQDELEEMLAEEPSNSPWYSVALACAAMVALGIYTF